MFYKIFDKNNRCILESAKKVKALRFLEDNLERGYSLKVLSKLSN